MIISIFFSIGSESQVNGDQAPKKKLTLSFEEYKSLSNMLVVFMRKEEMEAEAKGNYMHQFTLLILTAYLNS